MRRKGWACDALSGRVHAVRDLVSPVTHRLNLSRGAATDDTSREQPLPLPSPPLQPHPHLNNTGSARYHAVAHALQRRGDAFSAPHAVVPPLVTRLDENRSLRHPLPDPHNPLGAVRVVGRGGRIGCACDLRCHGRDLRDNGTKNALLRVTSARAWHPRLRGNYNTHRRKERVARPRCDCDSERRATESHAAARDVQRVLSGHHGRAFNHPLRATGRMSVCIDVLDLRQTSAATVRRRGGGYA